MRDSGGDSRLSLASKPLLVGPVASLALAGGGDRMHWMGIMEAKMAKRKKNETELSRQRPTWRQQDVCGSCKMESFLITIVLLSDKDDN